MRTGHVYFIKPVGLSGPIKIGCAYDFENRFHGLVGQSPIPLEILATVEGHLHLERRFHAKFLHIRSHYEWFHPEPELLETIEQIKAGTYDFDALPMPRRIPKMRNPERNHITPQWRYSRSVSSRVDHLVKRGLPRSKVKVMFGDDYRVAEAINGLTDFEHFKPLIERQLADWTEQYPIRSCRRSRQLVES